MKEIYNFNPIDYGFEVFVRSEAEEVYIKSLIDNRIDNLNERADKEQREMEMILNGLIRSRLKYSNEKIHKL